MGITLADIREQVRNRADMSESSFVGESELDFYINQSVAELHDILTDAYQSDYYMETAIITSVANQDSYALPEDFYELRGVDLKLENGEWFTIRRYNFNERNRYKEPSTWSVYSAPLIRYRLIGSNIRFNPAPNVLTDIRLWYHPKAQKLVQPTDEFQDFNGFIEYVIVDAAIKCLQKEESDISVLAAQKGDLERRIRHKAQNRDAGQAESVYDIYAENDSFPWRSKA